MEKYELLAKQAGNEDPFFLKAVKRAKVSDVKRRNFNDEKLYRLLDTR